MNIFIKTLIFWITLLNSSLLESFGYVNTSHFIKASEITSPTTNDVWLAGQQYPISWQNLDSNSIHIRLGVQKNTSNNVWYYQDDYGHDYLSIIYDSRINFYNWEIPLNMINLWEYPLRIFIKEIDTNVVISSGNFHIVGISIIYPLQNQTYYEYDTIPIEWSFTSLLNSFNISLCNSSVNLYDISEEDCSHSIINNLEPTNQELNSLIMTYDWTIPNEFNNLDSYKILITTSDNSVRMVSNSFFVDNIPSTTPTSTLTTTKTSTETNTHTPTVTTTVTTSLSTSLNSTVHIDVDNTNYHLTENAIILLAVFIPLLLIIIYLYTSHYCKKKSRKTKVIPTRIHIYKGSDIYNRGYNNTLYDNSKTISSTKGTYDDDSQKNIYGNFLTNNYVSGHNNMEPNRNSKKKSSRINRSRSVSPAETRIKETNIDRSYANKTYQDLINQLNTYSNRYSNDLDNHYYSEIDDNNASNRSASNRYNVLIPPNTLNKKNLIKLNNNNSNKTNNTDNKPEYNHLERNNSDERLERDRQLRKTKRMVNRINTDEYKHLSIPKNMIRE
jgi:hypothetical protein